MTDILSLIESGVTGLTLTIKSEDLKEFACLLIEKAKEQLLPVMVSAPHEGLLTKKEVLEKFKQSRISADKRFLIMFTTSRLTLPQTGASAVAVCDRKITKKYFSHTIVCLESGC